MASSPSPTIPTIFSPARRRAVRARMRVLQQRPNAARFLADDMAEDVLERLAFLRHEPQRALLIGDVTGQLTEALSAQGCDVVRADPAPVAGEVAVDEEQPLPFAEGFDLIASLGTLDTVNDLPGAMVHLRRALRPDGLAVISMMGAGSVTGLRALMLEADGDRPAARIHPQVDVRAGGQLLQRAGFADPVIDSRSLKVSYRSLRGLVDDVHAQGLGCCLQRKAPPLGPAGWARAQQAFERLSKNSRFIEQFEILTLSGWAKPLRAPKF
ncbi:class I SAM-dependent methyltransferase [Novosphingobium sp.]|uniref:class I SAM-dependent methyltransferase n=1 Tax=Novosphingobium sp. TaxID=1874826 RepID=UPI0038BD8A3B